MKKLENLTKSSLTFIVNGKPVTLPPNYLKGKEQANKGTISVSKEVYESLGASKQFKSAVKAQRIRVV